MKGENGSSALMVRLFVSISKTHFPPLLAYLPLSSSLLSGCRSYVPLLLSPPPRRHCYHLRGGQQQLQHGYKGRQQHQQATRSPGSLPQYLEQQVRERMG